MYLASVLINALNFEKSKNKIEYNLETLINVIVFANIVSILLYKDGNFINEQLYVNPKYKNIEYDSNSYRNLTTFSFESIHTANVKAKKDIIDVKESFINDTLMQFIKKCENYIIDFKMNQIDLSNFLKSSNYYQNCFNRTEIKERIPKWYEFFREVEQIDKYTMISMNFDKFANEFKTKIDLNYFKTNKNETKTKSNINVELVNKLLNHLREDANPSEGFNALIKLKKILKENDKDFDAIIMNGINK